MNKIPKIIHQIWGGENELPKSFLAFSETWKRDYPDWQYEFWDDERINKFVLINYPEYYKQFQSFPYDIQRWDSVRFLILNKIGGMYVDFDYESIKPINILVENQECCFALDPKTHYRPGRKGKELMLNVSLMLSIPNHWFIERAIRSIFLEKDNKEEKRSKSEQVYTLAGPWKLVELYYDLNEEEKEDIFLLSEEFISPLNRVQATRLLKGETNETELRAKLKDAYAIHYFVGDWR